MRKKHNITALKCCQCGIPDEIWTFKTSAMKNKIYFCWEHLQEAENKVAERGVRNLVNSN